MQDKWIKRFMDLARTFASWSEDYSTQVGAVVVSDDKDIQSSGWNGLPRGVEPTDERFERPNKYYYFEHAERNAIYNAVRNGVSLNGSHMFVTHYPCPDCARAIIQAGIKHVYFISKLGGDKWDEGNAASEAMLKEAGVSVVWLDSLKFGAS